MTTEWDEARGCARGATGDLSSEEFIRKMRDEEWGCAGEADVSPLSERTRAMQVTDEMVEAAVAANNEVWESSDVTNAETFHKARHSAMRAALTAALGAMWRPIETAPKDGTRMNLCWKAFCGISEHVELGRWSAKHDGWTNTYGHLFEGSPDYYQLLPTPPADGDQQ